MDWNEYFLKMCDLVASKSRDESTKCGCVIVGPNNEIRTTGYNGLPRGIEYTKERNERPEKYYWYCHAEQNAVFNAARVGTPLDGCTAYITGTPCPECARALIQCGIVKIILPPNSENHNPKHNELWKDRYARTEQMLKEANVKVVRT